MVLIFCFKYLRYLRNELLSFSLRATPVCRIGRGVCDLVAGRLKMPIDYARYLNEVEMTIYEMARVREDTVSPVFAWRLSANRISRCGVIKRAWDDRPKQKGIC